MIVHPSFKRLKNKSNRSNSIKSQNHFVFLVKYLLSSNRKFQINQMYVEPETPLKLEAWKYWDDRLKEVPSGLRKLD